MVYRAIAPISNARVRELWLDQGLTMFTLPEAAGCSYDTLSARASRLGLGPRHRGRAKIGGDLFRAMCLAGVSQGEIATFFNCSQSGVCRAIHRLKMDSAALAALPRITVSDFMQNRLRRAMAGAARIEQSSLCKAKMVDQIRRASPGMAEQAVS